MLDEKQFKVICDKLDKILGIIAVQNIEDNDDKVYLLKKLGFNSTEMNPIIGVQNVRQMEGWKRK